MTKILCVGDIHVMDRAPVNATESYTDDIIEMLKWIADYSAEQEVDAVVWAGDIFHHKQPSRTSHALVLRMIDVVRYYRKLKLDLCIVTGNHDISNDVLASVHEKQPLGVLFKAGARELDGWHPTLPLFGVPWQQNWTTSDDAAEEAFEDWRERSGVGGMGHTPLEQSLAVTHAPIYPPGEAEKQLFELVPTQGEHGLSSAMNNRGCLYFGHIHEDHGIFEVEGVTYANMGAISRGSLTEYNIERSIKVAMWEGGTFTEVVVPHKPASEVLRIAEVMEERSERISLDTFLAEVGNSTLDISSTSSVIDHIRGREDIPRRIRDRAIKILEEVE